MRAGGQPFYLQVNFPDAHRPFIKQVTTPRPLTGKEVQALPYMGINHPELRQQTADYYNCMMRLDTYIGQLLAVLEQSAARGTTVVVYIGDHGADMLRGKRTSYEGGLKVPMIIRWPNSRPDQRREELVSTLDLSRLSATSPARASPARWPVVPRRWCTETAGAAVSLHRVSCALQPQSLAATHRA